MSVYGVPEHPRDLLSDKFSTYIERELVSFGLEVRAQVYLLAAAALTVVTIFSLRLRRPLFIDRVATLRLLYLHLLKQCL